MSRPHAEIFKQRLKNGLRLRQITQAKLAELTGLKPAAISHFVSGERRPSFNNLRKLSDALRVSTDYLLGRADAPDGTAGIIDEFNRHMGKIENPADRDKVLEYVKMLSQKTK